MRSMKKKAKPKKLTKKQSKFLDKNKDGKITKKDFALMKKRRAKRRSNAKEEKIYCKQCR